MARTPPGERREMILQTLARMLEERGGERVTTALLARAVGVSEAALYRHFPSKARMFESLLEFIEQSLFSGIARILEQESATERRLQAMMYFVLGFAEKNPGMARILYGDILVDENQRLRRRVGQIYDRLETQLKQVLREGELRENRKFAVSDTAALLLAFIEGRIARFVRSDFTLGPAAGWKHQWEALRRSLAEEAMA